MSMACIGPALVSSLSCLAIVRGSQYICTHPEIRDGRIPSLFERVRESCASFRDSVVNNTLGESLWSVVSEIVLENLWISILVIGLLLQPYIPYNSELNIMENILTDWTCVALSGVLLEMQILTSLLLPPAARAIAGGLPRIANAIAAIVNPRGDINN